MKLKFKQQDFQTDAVNAVCALFDGQQRQTSTFSMEQSGGQCCSEAWAFQMPFTSTTDAL